jgi:hypothetical protein
MGCRVNAGEEETAKCRIASNSHKHGRTANGGKRRGGTGGGSGGSVAQGGRRPRHALSEWAEARLGAGPATKNPRKMENGMTAWFGPKSELGCRFDFEFCFKDLSLKSKVSNTFKPNLN